MMVVLDIAGCTTSSVTLLGPAELGQKVDQLAKIVYHTSGKTETNFRKNKMIHELTEQEIDYIVEYTGLDEVMGYPLDYTPIVFFTRNENVVDFVTILSSDFMGK